MIKNKYILIFIFLLLIFGSVFSQNTLKLNNSIIRINAGAYFNCSANVVIEDTGKFINNGEILVENDWINNSTDSALLGGGVGKVILYGDTQLISGTNITKFYKLELQGNNQKKLSLNTIVADSLILNDLEFATDSFKLFITSTDTGIITRTTGFISSLDTGCLVRNTNSTEKYLFPVGSNQNISRYRAIEIKPNSATQNAFSVRFANTDATNDGFDITNKEIGIGNINPYWYHRINRISGTSLADITIYKDVSETYDAMVHWTSLWSDMGVATSTTNKVTISAWGNFDTTAFVLTTKQPIIEASNDTSICEGENLQLNINIIAGAGPFAYYWSPSTYLNDSNLANPVASNITSDITYTVYVYDSSASAISNVDTVVITINPNYNFTQNITICDNDSVYLEGNWQNVSGTYIDTFSTTLGCDSIIATSLTVNLTYEQNVNLTICSNDSIFVGGDWQNTSGLYYDSLQTTLGCDSIIITDLTVNPSYIINANSSICNNDSIYLGGNWQNTSGIYTDSLLSSFGCDSIIITDLSINPTFSQVIDTAICSNDSIFVGGNWQNTSGVYYDYLQTTLGCDSVITTNLTVYQAPNIVISADTTICIGDNHTIIASGGTNYLWSTGDTDSIITVSPNINTTYFVTVSNSICQDAASTIVSVYEQPIALNDTVLLQQNDVNIITDVSLNDSFVMSYFTIISESSNGVANMQTNGLLSYTPNDYYYGEDILTYRLTDSICPNYFDEANVYYIISNENNLIIPNAITPNGDGIHDNFEIGGIFNYPKNELIIFNRWGNEIYSSKPYKNDWNGTGKDGTTILPNGTYYYVLKLNDTENRNFSGYIELVK